MDSTATYRWYVEFLCIFRILTLSISVSPLSSSQGPQQGCGGYLTSSTGMFGSPDINMDGQYEPRMDCVWTIAVEANKAINLTFPSFELEGPFGTNCRYDYVKVMSALCYISMSNAPLAHKYLSIRRSMMVTVLAIHWLEHTADLKYPPHTSQPVTS